MNYCISTAGSLSNGISIARIVFIFRIMTVNYYPHIFNNFYPVDYITAISSSAIYMSIMQSQPYIERISYILAYSGWSAVVAFTILSGFSLWISANNGFSLGKFLKSRIKRLYIPYIIAVIVALIVGFVVSYDITLKTIVVMILGVVRADTVAYDLNVPMWYMAAIILCYIAFPYLYKLQCKIGVKYYSLISITFLVAMIMTAKGNMILYPILPFYSFFMFGMCFADWMINHRDATVKISVMILPVLLLIMFWINYISPQMSEKWQLNVFGELSGFILLGLCEFTVFVIIGYKLLKNENKVLRFLSQGTIAVFMYHYILMPVIMPFMKGSLTVSIVLTYSVVLIILSCYQFGLDKLINRVFVNENKG